MSEQSFGLASQQNRYRGGRYPAFSSGGIDAAGNVGGVAPITNPGTLESSVRPTMESPSTGLTQMPEIPSMGESLKNAAIGAAVPYAASTFGASAGSALAGGAGFGEAISGGGRAVGESIGGLLGSSGGASTAPGTFFASEGGSAAGSSLGGSLGYGIGAGVGTAAATLLTGGDLKDAAKSGAGAAVGGAVGSALGSAFPVVGTAIGGVVGSAIGGAVGGGSVICTELNRQGFISDHDLWVETEFARKNISLTTRRGYWFWAKPYVRSMQRKDAVGLLMTLVALKLFNARFRAVKWRLGAGRFSLAGSLIRVFGEGMCSLIGHMLPDTAESRLLAQQTGV